jgi:mannosyltransferase
VGLVGRRLGGGMAGLAGGLVFALIPSVSRYAQEARPYAFATLFAALSTLMFLRAMERPGWSRWALYALVLTAAGAANLIAVTVAAGHLLIICWDFLQRTVRIGGDGTAETGRSLPGGRLAPAGSPLLLLKRFVLAVIASAVLLSPLAFEGHRQQGWQIGQQPVPHVAQLIGVSGGLWQELFASVPVAALVMLLAVLSLVAAPDARRRAIAGYALALAIAPVVAVWLISRGPTSYWTFRYMLFSIAGWSVGAGLCVAFLADRARGLRVARLAGRLSPRLVVVALVVLVVGAAGLHNQLAIRQKDAHNLWAYPDLPSNGTPVDYQAAAQVIEANQRPGDGIVYQVMDDNHYQVDTSIAYYLGAKLPTAVFQSQTQVQTNSLQPAQCANPASCHLKGTPRIWVVYVTHLAPDPFSALADPSVSYLPPNQPLSAQATYLQHLGYHVARTWQENGISVALLTVG